MFAPLQLLVQAHKHYFQKRGGDDGHECCADVEGHCEDVARLPLALVEIRDINARGVADGVDHGESGGAFGWGAGQGVADPGVADDEGGAVVIVNICIRIAWWWIENDGKEEGGGGNGLTRNFRA